MICATSFFENTTMGARRIMSMGGQIRGLGTKVSQQDPRGDLRKPPEADDRFSENKSGAASHVAKLTVLGKSC